ncbi:MAG: hypothetical protein KAJ42_08035 [Gemmatimonadetes bacterium]|nr:hypothetical protein [Gemmatimonadota bacterium]
MTFREDRVPGSLRAGEKSQTGTPSPQPKQPPPGNVDHRLGAVDFDEVEMRSLRRTLAKLPDRDPR